MSIILTRSKPSPSGSGNISLPTFTVDVDPSTTEVVDSLPLTFRVVKWLVVVDELIVNGKNVTYEVMAHLRPDGTLLFTQYGVLGDRILHRVLIVNSGTDVDLQVENNDANTLRILVTRIHIEP
jgi:hypothetical protein